VPAVQKPMAGLESNLALRLFERTPQTPTSSGTVCDYHERCELARFP